MSTFLSHRWVFVDSSAHLALFNRRDAHHIEARSVLSRLIDEGRPLLTTNFIVAETHALFLRRLHHTDATAFLRHIGTGAMRVERVRRADEERALAIVFLYTDKEFTLTDATSFSVMERLGIGTAFSFDRDFAQYGFRLLTP